MSYIESSQTLSQHGEEFGTDGYFLDRIFHFLGYLGSRRPKIKEANEL